MSEKDSKELAEHIALEVMYSVGLPPERKADVIEAVERVLTGKVRRGDFRKWVLNGYTPRAYADGSARIGGVGEDK